MKEKLAHEVQILAVEDDPGDFGLLRVYLRQAGYGTDDDQNTLRWAKSLSEAKNLAMHAVPDIILLDLNLPDSSGLDTVIGMRNAMPEIAIIVLSGNDNKDIAIAALNEGAQDYLVKGNYEHDALGKAVLHALIRSKLESRLRLFEVALNSASNGIVITDSDAKIQWANPAFSELTGYTLNEAIGHKPGMLVSSGKQSQSFYQAMWGTILSGSNWHGEIINRPKNGELYNEDLSIAPVLNREGKVTNFVAIKQDITDRKAVEDALRESEERYHLIFDTTIDGVLLTSPDGRILSANSAACTMFQRSEEELRQVGRSGVIDPSDPRLALALEERSRTGKFMGELTMMRKDGTKFPGEVSTALFLDTEGNAKTSMSIRDISERKAAELKLSNSEATLRAILDNAPYLIWLKDKDKRFINVNKAFLDATGCASMSDVLGKTDFDLWPEDLANKYRADDDKVMFTRKQLQVEELSLHRGRAGLAETIKSPIMDVEGHLLGTTGFSQDITERKNAEAQIRHLAHYDSLTDLPNRTLFSDRLQQALSIAKRDKTRMALMFLDLDKFKPINDDLGHHVGDLLLQEAANRMQDCVRESDTVARIGGDEFVVLLPVIDDAQDALLVAEKIRLALNQPFALVGKSLNISSSTGIVVYPDHGTDETQLVKNADIAMYYAKLNGRNNVMLYKTDMKLI